MSHVPDGELTAYADGAYAPADVDAQRIVAHLALCADCRNRLEQAHALSARAAEILAVATPAIVETPPFDQMRAQATARRARSTFPLAWAATVILALGIGWFGRGALRDPQLERALMRSEPRAEMATDGAADATVGAPAPPPSATAEPIDSRLTTPAAEERAEVRRAPQVAAGTELRTEAAKRGRSLSVIPQAAPAPPPAAAPEVAETDFEGQAAGRARASARPDIEYVTAAEAERRGIALYVVPELEIMRVGVREGGVRVEQLLSDGKVLTINVAPAPMQPRVGNQAAAAQRESLSPEKSVTTDVTTDSVVVTRGGKRITISAALPVDSLRVLAARIR
jgi:hypothetical protein